MPRAVAADRHLVGCAEATREQAVLQRAVAEDAESIALADVGDLEFNRPPDHVVGHLVGDPTVAGGAQLREMNRTEIADSESADLAGGAEAFHRANDFLDL